MKTVRFAALVFFGFMLTVSQAKPLELVFWHSMAGPLGSELKSFVQIYNDSQPDYHIKLVYKGNYLESLTSFAAAFRAKQPPALIQVFEVGSPSLISPPGVIKPLFQLMEEQHLALPESDFFKALFNRYSQDGHLMAMPFNTSIPVIFYNAEVLKKWNVSAETFPKTWDELALLAKRLRESGFECAYTTAYPSWILIESYSAIHGLPLVEDGKAVYNNPAVLAHLERLRAWQGQHYFEYGGRTDDAMTLFTSGRCPMVSQSSGAYQALASIVPFSLGVASLPLDKSVSETRYPNVVGGAALWVVSGQTEASYRGIATFFVWLAKPETQALWANKTGYLPLGLTGSYQTLTEALDPTLIRLVANEWGANVNDLPEKRSAIQNQVRQINDEAIELIFSGIKSPKAAMDEAVLRANHAMMRFRRNTRL